MSYAYRVDGAHSIALGDFDPADTAGLQRDEAEKRTVKLVDELIELQELQYAAHDTAILIILQGSDTSGKDGAVRHVLGRLNAQGLTVASFKAPTEEELSYDFLRRIHVQTPALGHIKVFNRSHYEDVLVARVRGLVKEDTWRARYAHINAFERLLADSRTVVIKFFLHISKEEQEERLLAREKEKVKAWKLTPDDWLDRDYWDDYRRAYEDVFEQCSTAHAPWFIVPADKKWFRNLAVAEAVRDVMLPYRQRWVEALEEIGREKRAALAAFRRMRE